MGKSSETIVFFGNEKLATGITNVRPVILEAVQRAGFVIERQITGRPSQLGPHVSRLAVLAAYGWLIPQSVLDEFPLGIINVHPSLLPRYRGPTPIEQAILDGADKTGVSLMRLSAGLDEGPLYKQKSIPLSGRESKQALAEALQRLGADLLVSALPGIASGQLKPRRQPHPERATYTRLITKSQGVINWNKPAERIEREIRAFAGWPKSHAVLAGKDVIITKAHAVPTNHPENKPGDVEVIRDFGIIMVECGNGYLCIDKLQPAGKNEMTSREFIRGYARLLG